MESFALTIFGITSNLAKIKLIPALYDLFAIGQVPGNLSIIGVARSAKTREEFHDYIHAVLRSENRHHNHPIDEEIETKMLTSMHYLAGQLDDLEFYVELKKFLLGEEKVGINCNNKIFYLATYPELYHAIFDNLHKVGLAKSDCGFTRLMIEKPIGSDRVSAEKLNNLLADHFTEDQIYRLDHYLGKETMQNILAFRFANSVFEPLMNKEYVDHIQVTATEDFGIGDRGAYYDSIGALKDIGQNHLLQMLAFATMDTPYQWSNQAITEKRIELLNSLVPQSKGAVFGQYADYKNEANVAVNSETDTFFAFKGVLGNDRFKDVPVYFRGGKYLAQLATEISIVFKNQPNQLFQDHPLSAAPNALIYRIQPNEGIVLRMTTKKSGHGLELEETYLQYCYRDYAHELADPYERLIIDAFNGDQTFFVDAPEIDAQWRVIDEIFAQKDGVTAYPRGGWGPSDANQVIETDGRTWLVPSMNFCAR